MVFSLPSLINNISNIYKILIVNNANENIPEPPNITEKFLHILMLNDSLQSKDYLQVPSMILLKKYFPLCKRRKKIGRIGNWKFVTAPSPHTQQHEDAFSHYFPPLTQQFEELNRTNSSSRSSMARYLVMNAREHPFRSFFGVHENLGEFSGLCEQM